MTGSLPTLNTLRQRYQYLRGETDYTTANAVNDSHINQAILDACNMFEWSWNQTKTTGSLSSGAFDLPADYNHTWHIPDARVVNASVGDDNIFEEIPVKDRDAYDASVCKHWFDFNTSSNRHRFNSNQTTGTVTYYYYYLPAALTISTDVCPIAEQEALAMLAVSKNWVGDERNLSLMQAFQQEGTRRLNALYQKEVAFGALYSEGTLVSRQSQLNGTGADQGISIARPY